MNRKRGVGYTGCTVYWILGEDPCWWMGWGILAEAEGDAPLRKLVHDGYRCVSCGGGLLRGCFVDEKRR